MTSSELITRAKYVAQSNSTVYMWGTFGQPVSENLIKQKREQYPAYYNEASINTMRSLIGVGYGFDCVGLIKGLLWGWDGNMGKANGGCDYASGGVPDINANQMILQCSGVTGDFTDITPGEVVWLTGHIGIYLGDGLVCEATPSWENGVQITACANVGGKSGFKSRKWTSHGMLPWLEYDVGEEDHTVPPLAVTPDYTVGSAVPFLGGNVYGSSTASSTAIYRTACQCEVTMIALGKAHPYHLIGGSDENKVYGWVDASCIGVQGQIGKLVYITGDKYATGETVPGWVKTEPHLVTAVSGNRLLLGSPKGINSYVNREDVRFV